MFELIGYWFIYFDWLLRKYWKWKGCYFCCCWFNFFIMNKKKKKRSKWANSITDFFFIIIFSILMYKCSDWLLRNFFKMKRMPIFLIYLVSLYWTKKKGFNLNLIFFLSLNSETLNFSFVRKKFWFSLFRWVLLWDRSILF